MKHLILLYLLSLTHLQAASLADLTLEITDGTITITDCNDLAKGVLEIPAQIDGATVTEIGPSAFEDCRELTEIILPNTITEIQDSAFRGCFLLTKINIPDPITVLRNRTFDRCDDLISITIPNSVTEIRDDVFASCFDLESVNIPTGITTIGERAFSRCLSLTSIVLPDTLTHIGSDAFFVCLSAEDLTIPPNLISIGSFAFDSCDRIIELTIPDSLTSIGEAAFSSCRSLETINVSENHPFVRSIDGVLFNLDLTSIFQYPGGKQDSTYEIPASVTSFDGSDCFSENSFIREIFIPEGIQSLPEFSFSGCVNLKTVHLPETLQTMGGSCFAGCTSLEVIRIPASVTTIINGSFFDSSSLRQVIFDGAAPDPERGTNAFFGTAAGATVCVTTEHAESFGGQGANWRGLEVQVGGPIIEEPPVVSTFESTISDLGLVGEQAAPDADPFNRGITNGIAYALDIPLIGELTPQQRRQLPRLSPNPGINIPLLTIYFPASPPLDVTYLIMESRDLTNWQEVGRKAPGAPWTGQITVRESSTADQVITFFTPSSDAQQNRPTFYQLQIDFE